MKQMSDLNCDPDEPVSQRRLMPLIALAICTLMFTSVNAETIYSDENTKIVTAMYGFVNTKYADPAEYTDDDYVTDLIQSIYGKQTGPDFSKDSVYIEHLVQSANGNTQTESPDFSNDDVYLNHLAEILLQ